MSIEDLIWRDDVYDGKKFEFIEEMCLLRDMSVSKITPKFLTELTGSKNLLAIELEDENYLERCIGVPIIIF